MNYLSNVVVLIIITFGLVHCNKKGSSQPEAGADEVSGGQKVKGTAPKTTTGGFFVLLNNASNDEEVRYSFNAVANGDSEAGVSPDEGALLAPDGCVKFYAADLPALTIWTGSGFVGLGGNVLCSGNTELSETPCTVGEYKVDDAWWWVFVDSYYLEELEEMNEDVACAPVSRF